MIMNIVRLPEVVFNFNPTVMVCQKMHHHRCTAFLKCNKNTSTTNSRKITTSSSSRGVVELGDDDPEKDRIFGGHFYGQDEEVYFYMVSTNGLGPKFELALETGMDDTIGIDLVAKSLNELITVGPSTNGLSFMYDIDAGFSEKVISCMVDACASICHFSEATQQVSATFALSLVEKDFAITGKNIEVGDVLIGLPSSGIHFNGFSLVRRVLEQSGCSLKDNLPGTNITLGESLMTPTVIYNKQVLEILSKGSVKGIAHIADGGLTGNITRGFPSGLGAVIFNNSWIVPPIFKWIQEEGRIEDVEMRRTFNMGIGIVLVVSEEVARTILQKPSKIEAYHIGEVVRVNPVMYQ